MLDSEALRAHCLSQIEAVEEFPFGPDVRVFKVRGRMFALMAADADPPRISLKCDPLLSEALRATHPAVQPGYHLNKRHWITVMADGTLPDAEVRDLIDHSYDRVVAGLPKRGRGSRDRRPGGGDEGADG